MKAEGKCDFKPKINEVSKYLVEGDPNKADEDLNERVKRLAVTDLQRREQIKKELRQQDQEQYTFKPEINQLSSMLARPKTFEELADYQEVQRKRTEKMMTRDAEEQQKCPFKPTLTKNKKYSNVQSHYTASNYSKKNTERLQKKKLHVTPPLLPPS